MPCLRALCLSASSFVWPRRILGNFVHQLDTCKAVQSSSLVYMRRGPWVILMILITSNTGLMMLPSPNKVTVRHGISDAELEKVLPSFDGIVVRSANRITRSMLVASPRVAIVGRAGSGVDNIDLQAASELGVPVVNSPTGNAGSVAG